MLNVFKIEFFTVEDYDRTVNKKLATFVRKNLRGFMELPVILKLSWSGITKRLAKQTNCKELIGIKSMKGIVMLFKGKITLRKKFSALKCEISCVMTFRSLVRQLLRKECGDKRQRRAEDPKKHCITFTGKKTEATG